MTVDYARAIKGKRAYNLTYNKCPFNRGRNVTLIGAIAIRGILTILRWQKYPDIYYKTYDNLTHKKTT